MAVMDKEAASEFLVHTLETYKEYPFNELVNDIGIGDDFYVVSEGDDGSKHGYSVSVEFEWENEARNSLVLTATIYGPNPKEGGVVPELQKESIVVQRP